MRPLPGFVAVALLAPLLACGPAGAIPPPGTTCPLFPADNVWHSDISQLPVHPRSAAWMASMDSASTNLHPDFGPSGGQPYGIPYDVVGASHQDVTVDFSYPDESDDVLYPFGPDITIEGGSDRHAIMLDKDACVLYELFDATYRPNGGSTAGSGAVFDLRSNALRPATWTSADAAGLPILAGLIRRDEVTAGAIDHAIRFTAQDTDTTYVWPARHQAGDRRDPNLPPMGARFRMKAAFSLNGFSQEARVILQAMKTFGLILADNGSNWYVGGASENGWSNGVLDELKSVPASAFEAVDASSLMIDPNSGQARQGGGGGATPVAVADFAFTPATVTVAQGGAVRWNFSGPSAHTATDASGTGLFGSGQRRPGTTYAFTFTGAGRFAYACSIHPARMIGAVKVPVAVSPGSGGTTTSFTVRWASVAPASGFVFDVQLQRPGSSAWTNWRTGRTSLSAAFVPNAGPGTYRFRSRLRKPAAGRASKYSPAATISVA